MGEQYFTREPSAAHDIRTLSVNWGGRAFSFQTDAGVFSRERLDRGTALLLTALPEGFGGRALDLGCGWGPVGAWMAAMWPQAEVLLTDVNERAAALARENLARNGLHATVYTGDGLAPVPGALDLIAVNPPIRAGKSVVYGLFAQSAQRLRPGGALYAVMQKKQGAESARQYLSTLFEGVEPVRRGGGFQVIRAIAKK